MAPKTGRKAVWRGGASGTSTAHLETGVEPSVVNLVVVNFQFVNVYNLGDLWVDDRLCGDLMSCDCPHVRLRA